MKRFMVVLLGFYILNLNAQVIYEAEDADSIYLGVIENEHSGFSGTGYVNGDNVIGSSISWNINLDSSQNKTLVIYFANGSTDNRSMDLYINDSLIVSSVAFNGTSAWITWSTQNLEISLDSGLNTIKLVAENATGGPNIDRIEIREPGFQIFKLHLNVFGDGIVNGATNGDEIGSGDEVNLTAVPTENEIFGGWRGDTISDEVNLVFNMKTETKLKAIFLRKGVYVETDKKVGWCDYEYNTIGGEGGTEVTVTNQSQLESYIGGTGKYIIKIQGTIEIIPFGKKMDVGSNKTILGDGPDAIIKGGGFRIFNAENVIIKYLTFKDAYVDWEGKTTDNDALEVNNSSHVWIDHCDFSHFDDGLIDIKNASDYVTVSWCHFHNHNKVMLIGASDNAIQDIDHLNVTVHHCWFDGGDNNGIGQRLPMGRFGMIHVFNNFYNDVITRCVEANYDANMVVDNNYFLNAEMPHALVGGAGDNKMNASGNIYVNSGTRRNNNGRAFNPTDYYKYEYDNAEDVPSIVMLGAGVNFNTSIGDSNYVVEPEFIYAHKVNNAIQVSQNYPNPFKDVTRINYYLPVSANLKIDILDISGKIVISQDLGKKDAGYHTYMLKDISLSSGIYFYKISSDNSFIIKQMVVK